MKHLFILLVVIFMLLLQLTSCKNDLNLESNPSPYIRDTIMKNYEWGKEQIISLGMIVIDSVVYNVISLDRIIEVANAKKKRRFITFSTLGNTYKYEINEEHFSLIGIKNNRLIVGDKHCKEEITELDEELLCFDCIKNTCLLREFE